MKHLLYLIVFLPCVALAQTPQLANPSDLGTGAVQTNPPGFSRKQKIGIPDPNLAQRLGATEAPLPTNRVQPQTLRATGNAPIDVPPLRLKIVRDAKSGCLFILKT